ASAQTTTVTIPKLALASTAREASVPDFTATLALKFDKEHLFNTETSNPTSELFPHPLECLRR
ncbi:hypothetical protein BGZ98_000295, partial [Dissophora globulifera]